MGLGKAMEGALNVGLEVGYHPVDHGKGCIPVRSFVLSLDEPAQRGEAGCYAAPAIRPYLRCMAELVMPHLAPAIFRAPLCAAQGAGALPAAVSIGCCFVPRPPLPAALAPI